MKLSDEVRSGKFHQYDDGQSCDEPTDVDTDAIADRIAVLEQQLAEAQG